MGRLEFRVFGAQLAEQRAALGKAFDVVERETREDLYFLGGRTSRAYKLRDGQALDLKQLVEVICGYQRWDALGFCELPASGAQIAACLDDPDNLPLPRSTGSLDALKVSTAFSRSGYIVIKVRKSRTRFDVGPCSAEMARIRLVGRPDTWTVSIEGKNAASLNQLKKALCLCELANQSYPEWLATLYPL